MTVTIPDATSTGLTGYMLVAGELVRGNGTQIRGFDPVAQAPLEVPSTRSSCSTAHWPLAEPISAAP